MTSISHTPITMYRIILSCMVIMEVVAVFFRAMLDNMAIEKMLNNADETLNGTISFTASLYDANANEQIVIEIGNMIKTNAYKPKWQLLPVSSIPLLMIYSTLKAKPSLTSRR